MRKAVIITDCRDIAYSEMHQTLSNELEKAGATDAVQIDPVVAIPNFSTINAAFSIRLLADLYPAGSMFLVVVSGLSGNPERIFGELGNGILFVGNNSGYLSWAARDVGIKSLFKNKLSKTVETRSFGGKYVQAPTAAKILAGEALGQLGDRMEVDRLADISIPDGTVVHCDNFGLMKIKAPPSGHLPPGRELAVYVNGRFKLKATCTSSMKNCPDGAWVLFEGSSLHGLPELGRVRSRNSADEIGVEVGDVITWEDAK